MPVQIPELKSIGPSEAPSVGRVQAPIPDGNKDVAQTSQALSGFLTTANKFVDKAEQDSANIAGTKAGSDYEVKYRARMAELKKYEGDPTEGYAKLAEESRQWKDDLLAEHEGSSNVVRRAVQDRINHTDYLLRDNAAANEATQYSGWARKVTEANVGLKQQGIMDAVELIHADDPSSIGRVKAQVELMQKVRDEDNARVGLVTDITDENGVVRQKRSAIADYAVKKDISHVMQQAIMTLNAEGKIDEAKMLMDEYGDQLLPEVKGKLIDNHHKSIVNVQASKIFDTLKGLSPIEARDKLRKMESNEVTQKAGELLNADNIHFARAKQLQSDTALDDYSKFINGKQFATIAELRSDPVASTLLSKMNHKDVARAEKVALFPEISDPSAQSRAFHLIESNGLVGMSDADFVRARAGLNKHDSDQLAKERQNANTETLGEQNASKSYVIRRMKEELRGAGIIPKGELSAKAMEKQNKATQFVMDRFNTIPKNASLDVKDKWIRDIVTQYKTNPDEPPPKKLESVVAPAPKNNEPMTDKDVADWTIKYKQANPGKRLSNMAELMKFKAESEKSK
jgi:hypothetical protein